MDIKVILNAPQKAIEQQWGGADLCPNSAEIIRLANDLNEITTAIKTEKKNKQLCSKAFKNAKGDDQAFDALKEQMQEISSQLNRLTKIKKQQEKALLKSFQSQEKTAKPTLPAQFSATKSSSVELNDISISEINTNFSTKWDSYVADHPNASLYHRYEWRNVIARSFSHQSHYFVALHNDAIVGILPTTRLRSRLFGDFSVSLPYFNYGGVLADNSDIANKLLAAAATHYQQNSSSHIEIRTTSEALCTWPNTTDKVSMIRQLPETTDQLDVELGTKIRAQIKRAQRENTETQIGGIDLLNEFYTVFARNMRDLGTPVYSKSFFGNILKQWPDHATVIVIRLNSRPVASAFLLGNRDMLEIPWASTLREANPLSINMLLYWEVLCFAIRKQYAFFDFGRSTKEANTYKFKKQWGAKPVQHYWYYWLNEGRDLPKLNPDNKKFKLAISLWKKIPVWITKIVGPFIVKNLP